MAEKNPIYQAKDLTEVFMLDEFGRLRWFPNWETLTDYGYSEGDIQEVALEWFYGKPMVESIVDSLTGQTYPPEETPNYKYYTGPVEEPPTPVVGIVGWLKANWRYMGVAGLGIALVMALLKMRR